MKDKIYYCLFASILLVVACGQNDPNSLRDFNLDKKKSSGKAAKETLYKSTITLAPIVYSQEKENKGFSVPHTEFGGFNEAKEMLEILESTKMRVWVNHQFELIKRYGIDSLNKNSNTFIEEYNRKVSFNISQNSFVHIEVYDRDQDTSTLIKNFIVDKLDLVLNEKKKPMADDNIKSTLKSHQLEINELQDSIIALTKLGVVDKESRKALSQTLKEIPDGKDRVYFLKLVEINNKYGAKFDVLTELLARKVSQNDQLGSAIHQEEINHSINNKHFIVYDYYPKN